MITGMVPFYSENLNELYENIKFKQFAPDKEAELTENCIDLLQKLFIKNPQQRLGMKDDSEVKRHPWFNGIDWEAVY